MGSVAVAQVTEQSQAQVNKQESLCLMSQLLEVSVYHLTYLRQLFPDSSYKTVRMKHIDNMDIRLLKDDFEDGRRVKAWMADVQEALSLGYLYKLHFCVAKDSDAIELIESYSYTFSYDASGVPSIQLDKNSKPSKEKKKREAQPTPETIRFEVVRMMRMLVTLTNTLDEVEGPYFITMRLDYHDCAPDDFELPAFQPMEVHTMAHVFERAPFCMAVGQVDTGHHKVALTMRSILDTDVDEQPDAEPGAQIADTPMIPDTVCGAHGDDVPGTADTDLDMGFDGDNTVVRKPCMRCTDTAEPAKEDEESPLQVADTPMTDSPHLEHAPKLQSGKVPAGHQEVEVPDMSRLKIGNRTVSASLAALREGDDVPRPQDSPEPPAAHAKRAPRQDASSTMSNTLLQAVSSKSTFTKEEAVQALPNTSARRVDRILACLVKAGYLKKAGSAGMYEVVANAAKPYVDNAETPAVGKRPVQAGRIRVRDGKAVSGAQKKRVQDTEPEGHENAQPNNTCLGSSQEAMAGSQGGVVLCSQDKRRGAVASNPVHLKKRQKCGFRGTDRSKPLAAR